jgi:hypothetical protein
MTTDQTPPEATLPRACQIVQDLLPLYVGGDEDSAQSTATVESHLGSCQPCRLEHETYREARGALLRLRPPSGVEPWVGEATPVELWPGISRALQEERLLEPRPHALRPLGGRWFHRLTLALCASLLFSVGLGIAYRVGSAQGAATEGTDAVVSSGLTGGPAGAGGSVVVDGNGVSASWQPAAARLSLTMPVEVYPHRALTVPARPGAGARERYLQREYAPVAAGVAVRF